MSVRTFLLFYVILTNTTFTNVEAANFFLYGLTFVYLSSPCVSISLDSVPPADIQSLKLVHAVWRHGDRTPSSLLPGDDIRNWPLGLGELTPKGVKQAYQLGQILRHRYAGFLSSEYTPFEVYIRSSDYNRTLASGHAVASGLYPRNADLPVNPIPVHTVPRQSDNLLYDRISCPVAEAERHRVYTESDEVREIASKNDAILRFLGEKSQIREVPLTVRDLWYLFDPLFAMTCHNDTHKLPAWVNSTVKDEIWRLYDISAQFLYGSELLNRLRGGPLLGDILKRINMRVDGTLDSRFKFFGYSAHDTAISAVLRTLNLSVQVFPLYATCLLLELHFIDNTYKLRVFFKNETETANIVQFTVPGCATDCPLVDLGHLRGHMVPSSWEVECGLDHRFLKHDAIYLFIILIMSLLCALLATMMLHARLNAPNKRRQDSYELQVTDSACEMHLLASDEE
uniref:Lysosomal acid phosphatase n=1 Tax=Panagrellus redivivus TaxID=6233 RepID=A0A7E4W156_PANRE